MNPIDDFFKEKLENHEVRPSDRANQLFLGKLENKKKKKPVPYWYFALAASLFIFSLAGVYFYNNQSEVNSVITSTEPNKEQISTPSKEKLLATSIFQNGDSPLKSISGKVQTVGSISSQKIKSSSKEVAFESLEKRAVQVVENKALELFFEEETETKLANIEEARQSKLEETLIYLTPILTMNQVNTFSTSPRVLENKNTEMGIVSEEYFSDDKSLLTRVLDEVKGLKKGEKVDFNKLGFKSIEELALDKEGFIVSETNQIKDKIHWIRTRLNNN